MANFEMSQAQFDKLVEACKPVPLIALQCGMPSSPQERANSIWKSMGEEMGFKHITARPIAGKSELFFSAEEVEDGTNTSK